jgi:hypothetical protein
LGIEQGRRYDRLGGPLSPANLESGHMKFLPGSQTQDHLQHVDPCTTQANSLSRGQAIAVKVDSQETVDCIVNPGETSLHHVKLVHGSEPNRSVYQTMNAAPPKKVTELPLTAYGMTPIVGEAVTKWAVRSCCSPARHR